MSAPVSVGDALHESLGALWAAMPHTLRQLDSLMRQRADCVATHAGRYCPGCEAILRLAVPLEQELIERDGAGEQGRLPPFNERGER